MSTSRRAAAEYDAQRFHTVKATVDDVRKWAWGRGLPVHTTGSLPVTVIRAYNRAHPEAQMRIKFEKTREDFIRSSQNGARNSTKSRLHKKEHA